MSFAIPDLLNKLSDPKPEIRLLAIKRLGMYYDPAIADHLLKLLMDQNAEVREATIISLGALGESSKIIRPIIDCLGDEVISVKLAAIKVLGELRSIKATKPLIKLLSDEEVEIREATIIAMGQIEDKNALFPLIDCLEDDEPSIRINAILALGQIGDLRSIEPIIEKLKDEPSVQQMAALTLGKFEDPRIISPLIDLLSSEVPKTRQCAIVSLGALKNPEVIEPMLKLLNDSDISVRRAAANALSEIKDKTTVEHFIARLKDENDEIRETAARALGKLKSDRAILPLIEVLKDNQEEVREEAAKSLGELKTNLATRPLIKLLKDKVPAVRASAAISLGKIEGSSDYGTSLKEKLEKILGSIAIRPLTRRLSDSEIIVREKSAEALAKICINQYKFKKAHQYYRKASEEALTWDYHQIFYEGCSKGTEILDNLSRGEYEKNIPKFEPLYDNLSSAAKMIGMKSFVSESYWNAVEIFNNLLIAKNKDQFIKQFREFGMNILLLQKKLPEEFRFLLDEPQDHLNNQFQIINKRGLQLEESIQEMEPLREDVFDIGNKILQLEPLEVKLLDDQETTIRNIEDLIATPNAYSFQGDNSGFTESAITQFIKSSPISTLTTEKKFSLEEVEMGKDQNLGEIIQVSLIQILKGARRLSLIEEPREIFDRCVKRYYDYDIYRNNRVLQFTKEAITMRVKPKIIGYMDDAIYEGSSLVIFPELSVPYNYIEKLKGFADRYNLFIIAGVENILEKNEGSNRVYVIPPFEGEVTYQQKNTPTILESSEKFLDEWHENIVPTIPPVFRLFNTPFGRFIILIGQDIIEFSQYIPFITREKELDFIIMLAHSYFDERELNRIQSIAVEIHKPILFVNTGQFGGTGVYLPSEDKLENQLYLRKEFTEGILQWNLKIPERLVIPNSYTQNQKKGNQNEIMKENNQKTADKLDLLMKKVQKKKSSPKKK